MLKGLLEFVEYILNNVIIKKNYYIKEIQNESWCYLLSNYNKLCNLIRDILKVDKPKEENAVYHKHNHKQINVKLSHKKEK